MPPPDDQPDEFEHTKMSFGEHLEQLRTALFKSLLALLAGFAIGLFFGQDIVAYIQTPLKAALQKHYRDLAESREYKRLETLRAADKSTPDDLEATAKEFADRGLLPHDWYLDPRETAEAFNERYPGLINPEDLPAATAEPLPREKMLRLRVFQSVEEDPRTRVIGLEAQEPFMAFLKASLVAGAIIASPLIFFYIWDFIAAGLYKHERKYIYMYLPISLGLFFAGAALAFYVAFDFVLKFLFQFYSWTETEPSMQLSEWMSFVLMLPLGFGISFQLPLVMLMLQRIGVFTIESYWNKWRVAVIVIAVLSMFLTPADPGSMLVMGVPLIALYFVGIALCKWMPGARHERPQN